MGFSLGLGGFTAAAGAGAWAMVANIGALLIISGISEMLADDPKLDGDTDPMNNFNFSNIAQIARAGAAIPVVYGEIIVGSVVISQSVEVSNSQILTTA